MVFFNEFFWIIDELIYFNFLFIIDWLRIILYLFFFFTVFLIIIIKIRRKIFWIIFFFNIKHLFKIDIILFVIIISFILKMINLILDMINFILKIFIHLMMYSFFWISIKLIHKIKHIFFEILIVNIKFLIII